MESILLGLTYAVAFNIFWNIGKLLVRVYRETEDEKKEFLSRLRAVENLADKSDVKWSHFTKYYEELGLLAARVLALEEEKVK